MHLLGCFRKRIKKVNIQFLYQNCFYINNELLLQNRLLANTYAEIGNRNVTKGQTKKEKQLKTQFWELIGL